MPKIPDAVRDVGGKRYLVVRSRSAIHENYQLHAKKRLRPSNHATARWLERVGTPHLQRTISSSFKLIHLKKVLIDEAGTRIYVSHKGVAFIVAPHPEQVPDYVIVTILTEKDVAGNPNKMWWFE